MPSNTDSKRCQALTAKGKPCRAWAMQDSALCAAHSGHTAKNRQTHGFYARPAKSRPASCCGGERPESRPRGKGLETIDDVIADALDKQARLSAILDTIPASAPSQCLGRDNTADLDGAPRDSARDPAPRDSARDLADLAKLLAIHGQNASRLGRLLRDKRALSGESADGLLSALGTALDEIATELGITL